MNDKELFYEVVRRNNDNPTNFPIEVFLYSEQGVVEVVIKQNGKEFIVKENGDFENEVLEKRLFSGLLFKIFTRGIS